MRILTVVVKTVQVKFADRKNPQELHHTLNVVVQDIKQFLSVPDREFHNIHQIDFNKI